MNLLSRLCSFTLLLSLLILPLSEFNVSAAAPKLFLKITQKDLALEEGSSKTLTVSSNIKPLTLQWATNNSTVATVSKQGTISAKKAGKVTITVSHAKTKLKATATVNVTSKIINVSKITVSDKFVSMTEGESVQISAKAEPTNATNKKINWESLNPSIATVEEDGTINAIKAGSTTLKITSANKKVSAVVSVKVDALKTEAPTEPSKPPSTSLKDIIKKVSESVVYIEAYNRQNEAVASGSGFILSADGRIVTNFHVISSEDDPIKSVKIKLVDGASYTADTVVGYDQKNDLAVLKIDQNALLKPVTLGNSDLIDVGDKIITIGSPLGLENTVSEGIISNKNRIIHDVGYIQISAPISHGSSGGALINEKGEVIGVTSAGIDGGQNLNFAIPVNRLKALSLGKESTILSLNKESGSPSQQLSPGEEEIYESESNNTMAQANPISKQKFAIIGSIASQYDVDHYSFTLRSNSFVSILAGVENQYSHLSPFLMTGIVDRYGEVVLYGQKYYYEGKTYQHIEGYLSPGTYYLVFFGSSDVKNSWSLRPQYIAVGLFE